MCFRLILATRQLRKALYFLFISPCSALLLLLWWCLLGCQTGSISQWVAMCWTFIIVIFLITTTALHLQGYPKSRDQPPSCIAFLQGLQQIAATLNTFLDLCLSHSAVLIEQYKSRTGLQCRSLTKEDVLKAKKQHLRLNSSQILVPVHFCSKPCN